MPELPEVEIVARGLEARIKGRTIDQVEVRLKKLIKGDADSFAQDLAGKKIKGVRRKGKVMVLDLGRAALGVHLKMTGRFSFEKPAQPPARHTHLVFTFKKAPFELHYHDLRRFGWFELIKPGGLNTWPAWAELGPDALSVSEEDFCQRLGARRGRLKPLLLNQGFIAGLGNIYADEALFRAGLHPLKKAEELKEDERRRLFAAVGQVLSEALVWGGSSVANFRDAEGRRGYFQTRHLVYHRQGEPCPRCGEEIARISLGGRSSHFCPACQPDGGR